MFAGAGESSNDWKSNMKKFQPLENRPPVLELDRVTLRTPAGPCFATTRWRWKAGQHWALLGPNGSGKSLLARAVAGLVPVCAGEIRYGFPAPAGRPVEDAIALVSFEQQHGLALDGAPAGRWYSLEHADAPRAADLLARDSVDAINPFQVDPPPRRSARSFAQDRRRIVDLLGIGPLLRRDLLALSTGERRKVLIARALLARPRLLILDDPFAGLDADSRTHFRDVIDRLAAAGALHLLLITMRPEELPRCISHVLDVRGCRVVRQGPRLTRRAAARPHPPRPAARSRAGAGDLLLEINRATVRYGRATILRAVSLQVRRGESWAVLGPNGSGKTTLLSLITGDNPQAYANDVQLFGHRRGSGESIWDLRRRIAVVSPDVHLATDAQARLRDLPGGRRAGPWLRKLGLAEAGGKLFGELSPGAQRLGLIACALARRPDLLVLDEPGQGLDDAHRARLRRVLEAVIRTGHTTVLYVTHHSDEIPAGISRVLRLRDGVARPGVL